jgi:calcium/calmodulin-dependent protein kinase (CaM kinase) II
MPDTSSELIRLTQDLLDSIAKCDWGTYARLSDPSLTAFEPEALGGIVEGLPFHRFYFELGESPSPRLDTISSPHVRVMGDVAIVAYTRLVQRLDGAGRPQTTAFEETRVWQKIAGAWKHVHFHRSTPTSPRRNSRT